MVIPELPVQPNPFVELYYFILANLDRLLDHDDYRNKFSPESNRMTKKLVGEGYDIQEAYAMSITLTVFLYDQLMKDT